MPTPTSLGGIVSTNHINIQLRKRKPGAKVNYLCDDHDLEKPYRVPGEAESRLAHSKRKGTIR